MRRPFWIHQLIEYLVGVGLIGAAIQMPEPAVPALLGLLVVVNAAMAKGAAGAFSLVGKRLHGRLDLVVIGLLVATAVQPWASVDGTSRLMIGAIAFVLLFVWFHTDFTERAPRSARGTTPRPSSHEIGRGAGRVVGGGVNSLKRWKDSFSGASTADDDDR